MLIGKLNTCMTTCFVCQQEALPRVQPSAKREGFATIPDVTWDDVGALRGVREELTMAILVSLLFTLLHSFVLEICVN